MPAVIVYTCTSGGSAVSMVGSDTPTCPTGQGQWQAIAAAEDFDVSNLSIEEVTAAWGAGFTVMAIGLVIVAAGRALLRTLK